MGSRAIRWADHQCPSFIVLLIPSLSIAWNKTRTAVRLSGKPVQSVTKVASMSLGQLHAVVMGSRRWERVEPWRQTHPTGIVARDIGACRACSLANQSCVVGEDALVCPRVVQGRRSRVGGCAVRGATVMEDPSQRKKRSVPLAPSDPHNQMLLSLD